MRVEATCTWLYSSFGLLFSSLVPRRFCCAPSPFVTQTSYRKAQTEAGYSMYMQRHSSKVDASKKRLLQGREENLLFKERELSSAEAHKPYCGAPVISVNPRCMGNPGCWISHVDDS
ncbi:hypothetical protein BDZ91DRAFT_349386 [Kalaharituber pfeilii]|nr:hypothetical protein BDZ91DRAFT_349386 [Kalaharituber pfeilii]